MELCKPCFERGYISEGGKEVKGTMMCENCHAGKAPNSEKDSIKIVAKDSVPPRTNPPRGRTDILLTALKALPVGKVVTFTMKSNHGASYTRSNLLKRFKAHGMFVDGVCRKNQVWFWRIK